MLSIGQFSKICEVSTKTLRYYDEIGLLKPSEVNHENGYRYYASNQLEIMLFINRLKLYNFSLDEIKAILEMNDMQQEVLVVELHKKKKEMEQKLQLYTNTLEQLNEDLSVLNQGKSMMSYLENVDIQLVEVATMHLLSIRKNLHKFELADEYKSCFYTLLKTLQEENLTMLAPPMVLFHSDEFHTCGMDIEFAIPIAQATAKTNDFHPGLCVKSVLHGSYRNLSSIYTKQCTWAEQHGYENHGALFEVYLNDPSTVVHEEELVTEIYYPIIKK